MTDHMIQMGAFDGDAKPRDPRLSEADRKRLFDPFGHASSGAIYWLIEEVLALREKVKKLEERQNPEAYR